jgi:hypothetical protein
MKLIHAVSLAVSLARAAGTAATEVAPVYAPPPSGYYGDYGPPLRYVLALSGCDSLRTDPNRLRAQAVQRNMPTRIAMMQPHCSSTIRSRSTSAAKASVTSGYAPVSGVTIEISP